MRTTLLRGALFSGSGAFIILLGGVLLPLSQLEIWGMPILFTGLLLVFVGMTPYRRLAKLEVNPYVLQIDSEKLSLNKENRPLFSLFLKHISSLEYIEKKNIYGIAFKIKRPIEESVQIFDARFIAQALKEGIEADLFLPYFSKRSFEELETIRHA